MRVCRLCVYVTKHKTQNICGDLFMRLYARAYMIIIFISPLFYVRARIYFYSCETSLVIMFCVRMCVCGSVPPMRTLRESSSSLNYDDDR